MKNINKPYIEELRSGHYHVIINGQPVYDNAPYGNDKPIVFKDSDAASNYLQYYIDQMSDNITEESLC